MVPINRGAWRDATTPSSNVCSTRAAADLLGVNPGWALSSGGANEPLPNENRRGSHSGVDQMHHRHEWLLKGRSISVPAPLNLSSRTASSAKAISGCIEYAKRTSHESQLICDKERCADYAKAGQPCEPRGRGDGVKQGHDDKPTGANHANQYGPG